MKFHRPKGFFGSAPRKWIDKNLPVCPFCKKEPLWEMAQQFNLGWHRYHFRCPDCLAVLSIPIVDTSGPELGMAWLVRRAAQKVLRVESVGANVDLEGLVGQEYGLDALRNGLSKIKNLQP